MSSSPPAPTQANSALRDEEQALVKDFLTIVTKRRHSTGGSRPGARGPYRKLHKVGAKEKKSTVAAAAALPAAAASAPANASVTSVAPSPVDSSATAELSLTARSTAATSGHADADAADEEGSGRSTPLYGPIHTHPVALALTWSPHPNALHPSALHPNALHPHTPSGSRSRRLALVVSRTGLRLTLRTRLARSVLLLGGARVWAPDPAHQTQPMTSSTRRGPNRPPSAPISFVRISPDLPPTSHISPAFSHPPNVPISFVRAPHFPSYYPWLQHGDLTPFPSYCPWLQHGDVSDQSSFSRRNPPPPLPRQAPAPSRQPTAPTRAPPPQLLHLVARSLDWALPPPARARRRGPTASGSLYGPTVRCRLRCCWPSGGFRSRMRRCSKVRAMHKQTSAHMRRSASDLISTCEI